MYFLKTITNTDHILPHLLYTMVDVNYREAAWQGRVLCLCHLSDMQLRLFCSTCQSLFPSNMFYISYQFTQSLALKRCVYSSSLYFPTLV